MSVFLGGLDLVNIRLILTSTGLHYLHLTSLPHMQVSGLQLLLSTERGKNHSNTGDQDEARKRIAALSEKV